MAEATLVWAATGRGPVIGITPSRSARNTLAAQVPQSCNTAQFLGHLFGHRGALGSLGISEGTSLLIDESSMIPASDLSDLISRIESATARQSWPVTPGKLQAVETGGAIRVPGSASRLLSKQCATLAPDDTAISRRIGAGTTVGA
jgi:hypothetical protein